jgi:phospholipid/cholesterol/gamma-HCH transport system substrate-binding protein
MENNANYALVGALATAVVIALFGFIYWFAGPSSSIAMKPFDVVFTGTVSGIGKGTDVLFNGIKVGQVQTVELDPTDSKRVVARIEVVADAPVRADTRALMGFQGLTGVGSVQLSGGTQEAGEPAVGQGRTAPTLYAEVSDFQSILDGLSTTINGASTAVTRLNGFLDENDERLNNTIANAETFSSALASNADGVEALMASLSETGKQIGPMTEQITALSKDLRGLVNAVPPERVSKAVADVSVFTESLARNSDKIDEFFSTTEVLAANLKELTQGLSASVAVIDQVAAEIDPKVVGRVISNVDKFAARLSENSENFDTIVANVDKFASRLGDNADNFDTIAANATKLSEQLVASAARIDDVIANVDGLVTSPEGKGLFNEISAAAMSVRVLADQLNTSTTKIGQGLNNFTSRGLSEYTSLAVDARQTLQRLDRVVRNLENNPQGLIFGGETVREYNKR